MTWLRHNRWYLIAVAVLLPVAIVVALSSGYFAYLESRDGRQTIVVGNTTVEYSGAQWSLLEWHSFSSDSDAGLAAELLPGTSLVTATIGVRPGDVPPGCLVELADASDTRRWDQASFLDTTFEIVDGAEGYCSTTAEGPYKLQVFFVVPDDALGDMRLRLWDAPTYPETLVFPL
jgi:hypothetical protein